MPGFNGLGPEGAGPLTGGGRGACASDDPRVVRRFFGLFGNRGRGMGRGREFGRGAGLGRGYRHGWHR